MEINLTRNAYIKLVSNSTKTTITKDELKELLHYYKNITSKTGTQIDWKYDQAAFPYEIIEDPNQGNNSFTLYSEIDRYHSIRIEICQETINQEKSSTHEQTYIRITLPKNSTHGDKGKANEYCKFIAKQLHGDLHLFNGRIMYFSHQK